MVKPTKINKFLIGSIIAVASAAMPTPAHAQTPDAGNPTETAAVYSNPSLEGHYQALLGYFTAEAAGIELIGVEPSALTVELLKSRLDPKYEFIIGDLGKIRHRFNSEAEMTRFYTDGVFLSNNGDYNDIFAMLLMKDKTGDIVMDTVSLEKVRQNMKSQLEKERQMYADSENEASQAGDPTADAIAEDTNAKDENADTSKEEESSNPMWYILGIVSGIFIGIVAYLISAKLSSERKKNEEIRELRAMVEELNTMLEDRKSGAKGEEPKATHDAVYSDLSDEVSIESIPAKYCKTPSNNNPADIKNEDKQQADLPAVLYVGVPSQGIFGEGYTSDRPAKTLYRLNRTDASHAKFSFISSDLNYRLVKSNITQFVESAAEIENEENRINFTSIVTVVPGEVEKCGDGWEITKKALIRFI